MPETYLLFLKGLALGFAIAAPVGPIGLLCIRRSLNGGFVEGFFTGLGAATADALYGMVAALGLTAISSALLQHQGAIRLLGGVFLLYLGVRTMHAPIQKPNSSSTKGSLGAVYSSALLLTLTNPATILSFLAIFAGLGLGTATSGSGAAAVALVGGVFLGSAFWWVLLSSGVSAARGKLSPTALIWANRISGLVILGFALLAFAAVFMPVPSADQTIP